MGHIAFGAYPVGVRVASCLHYLLNQCVDFDQTSTDTLLGGDAGGCVCVGGGGARERSH